MTPAASSSQAAGVTLGMAHCMLWPRRYGFQTAVLLLLASSTGMLDQVFATASGMC